MKKFISLILSFAVSIAVYTPITAVAEETESFFDDFTGNRLDTENWLIAEKTGAEQSILTAKKWIITAE